MRMRSTVLGFEFVVLFALCLVRYSHSAIYKILRFLSIAFLSSELVMLDSCALWLSLRSISMICECLE